MNCFTKRFFQTFRPKPLLLVLLVLVFTLYPALAPIHQSSERFENAPSLPVISTHYEGSDPVRHFFQEYVGHVRPVWADSTGPNSFGTFATVAYGTKDWANPGYAVASDNAYATSTLASAAFSYYLKATNAGFTIPAGATILGIYAEFERKGQTTLGDIIDKSIKIVKGDVIGGTEKSAGASWPLADAYAGYGGATDLWGLAWTPADINAATFGFAVAALDNSAFARTPSVDHMRITVYYTAVVTITWALSGVNNDATGTIIAIDGTNYGYADFPKAFSWTIGSTKSVAATDPVPAGTGKQYDWTQWTNGDGLSGASGTYTVPASAITVTAVYATQWYLTVTSSYDSPTGQAWYTSGNSASSTVTSPVSGGTGIQYVCTGWTGTGSAPASGSTADTGLFSMTAASSVTWSWKTQYSIAFTSSGISTDTTGTVVTVNTAAKIQSQLPFTAWYDSASSVVYAFTSPVAATSGKQYVWSSTSGLSQTLQSNTFSASATGTVTGTYGVQWSITITQSGIGSDTSTTTIVTVDTVNKVAADLPFTAWYNNGASISYSYASQIYGTTYQYGWVSTSGCGQTAISGTETAIETCTLTGNYGIIGGTVTLTTTIVSSVTTTTTGSTTLTTTSVQATTTTATYTSVTVAVTLTSETTITNTFNPGGPIAINPAASLSIVQLWKGNVNQTDEVLAEIRLLGSGAGVSFIITDVQVNEMVRSWVTLNETKSDLCSCYKTFAGGQQVSLRFRIAPSLAVAAGIYNIDVQVSGRTSAGISVAVASNALAVTVNSILPTEPTILAPTVETGLAVVGLGFAASTFAWRLARSRRQDVG